MNKAQWITATITLITTLLLYAFTQKKLFGEPKKINLTKTVNSNSAVTIDSFFVHVKDHLTPFQIGRLNFIENNLNSKSGPADKIHVYHHLARYWKDSVQIEHQQDLFEPFAWYTAEAARLENSEKSLTFAARLFWSNFRNETHPEKRKWKALQAKDLYERSLKINPSNDSTNVELGEVYVYGGFTMPMQGVEMIKKVSEKDEKNIYAQLALTYASLSSGQTDKAIERLKKIIELQPSDAASVLLLAEIYETKGDKKAAIEWYQKSLPLLTGEYTRYKKEVEERIDQINKLK